MKKHSLFRQYIWLLNTIHRAGRISLDEINRYWVANPISRGVEISRRTFIRHRNDIEDMFGILIECDKKDGFRYYISNPEDLESSKMQNWMLNSLATSSLLMECNALKDQILLEDIPSGQLFLDIILQALSNKQMLRMTYQRFGVDEPVSNEIEPYCLKLYHQRWYVVVHIPTSKHTTPITYALDRIKSLEIITGSHYEMPENFSASGFFKNFFGVFVNENYKPERVVIRAFGNQADYLRTLPLHSSQIELESTGNESESYADFEYFLAETDELVFELISKNSQIEVLEPASLRLKMRNEINKMFELYREI